MIINGLSRINVLNRHLTLPNGTKFYVGLNTRENSDKIKEIGFSKPLVNGKTILPSSNVSQFSYINTFGKQVIDKSKRETVQREIPYRVTDWHGQEHTGTYIRDYERYKREIVMNYNFEFSIIENGSEKLLIIRKEFNYGVDSEEEIIFGINLILSIFGEAIIFKDNLEQFASANFERANWKLMPLGEAPFSQIQKIIERRYSENYKRGPILKRFEFLEGLKPSKIYVGEGGFSDYLAYVFDSKEIVTLESIEYGNALYIVGLNWKDISKKTKKEILQSQLEKERIIHTESYYSKVRAYLK